MNKNELKNIDFVGKNNISFNNGEILGKFNYKKSDWIVVQKNNDNTFKLIDKHVPRDTEMELDRLKNLKVNSNIALEINKFTNKYNLSSDISTTASEDIIDNLTKNHSNIKMSFKSTHEWISFKGAVLDRLIIGLGGHSIFETSITLHHVYGVPYIPGQAIKGVLRNFIIKEEFNSVEQDALVSPQFQFIFGTQDNQGNVIFLDAYPDKFEIVKDIMTPHHSDYYQKDNSMPLDNDKITPIQFLAVQKAIFNFNIGIRKVNTIEMDIIEKYIVTNLVEALAFGGIGAKTSVGYGFFDVELNSVEDEIKKEKELMNELINEQAKLIEISKKQELELIVFKDATKNMSPLEIELFLIGEISNSEVKKDRLMFMFSKIDEMEIADKIVLARAVKQNLIDTSNWNLKNIDSVKKADKNSNRIRKILKILDCEA